MLLHYIPDVQGLTAIKKDNYLAEGLFLTCFLLFQSGENMGKCPVGRKADFIFG